MSAIELKTLHHDIFEFYQLVSPLHTCHPPGNPNAPNSLPMIPTQYLSTEALIILINSWRIIRREEEIKGGVFHVILLCIGSETNK